MGAARDHGIIDAFIIDAFITHEIPAAADTAYQGAGPTVAVPQRRRRKDPDTGRFRKLSQSQKDVNTAHARRRRPGERANAELKNWRIPAENPVQPEHRGQAHRRSSDPHDRQRLIRLAKPQ
ncbi:hypothetical protein Ae717Ps2_6290 [Pseudonocardia sp. Ae717_Ps2]|nr:hypothetical protein Ae717Ps2_6290 [Pseudonocardia sp. Ae717_Ps2]